MRGGWRGAVEVSGVRCRVSEGRGQGAGGVG